MDESTTREKVLKNIRHASISKLESPFTDIDFNSPIYQEIKDSLDIAFAQEFTRIAGRFVYCLNLGEFSEQLRLVMEENKINSLFCLEPGLVNILKKSGIPYTSNEEEFLSMRAGLTACEFLISRLGSIMISSKQASGRRLVIYPEIHIVLARTGQIVPDLIDALQGIKERYGSEMPSMISVISGPSRTADIEKTLVMGAHGPREVYVFLLEDEVKE